MRRATFALLVGFLFALIATPVATHTASAASLEDRADKTVREWAKRINEKDIAVFDYMSADGQMFFFGTDDPEGMLKSSFRVKIYDVSHVVQNQDGSITARVSYRGLNTKNGYNTLTFFLFDAGEKYLKISGAAPDQTYLPQEEAPATPCYTVSFPQEGPASIEVSGNIHVIGFDNQSDTSRMFYLFKKNGKYDPAKPLASGYAMKGQPGLLAFSDLKSGTYIIVDGGNLVDEIATITVK